MGQMVKQLSYQENIEPKTPVQMPLSQITYTQFWGSHSYADVQTFSVYSTLNGTDQLGDQREGFWSGVDSNQV